MTKSTAKSSASTHRTVQQSTTLSRKYVRRPSSSINISVKTDDEIDTKKIAKAAKAEADDILRRQKRAKEIHAAKVAEMKRAKAKTAKKTAKLAAKSERSSIKKARQAKDRAIRQALRNSATSEQPEFKPKHTFRKVLLATTCSALAVAALAVFVHYNMPDITVRVAALQSGIDATYPSYIPRGYSLSNVTSSKDNITMYFKSTDNNSFELIEELSTWDSAALLNGYVKPNFSKEYITLREQGVTIYIDDTKAAWVNGGVLYKVSAVGKPLTKEQIRNLATSL